MYRKLSLSLASDTAIITANKRLAMHLQALELGPPRPSIEALDTWILRLWSEQGVAGAKPYRLLSEAEQCYLWQQVVSESLEDYPLLQVSSTASLAQKAWLHLKLWLKTPEELDLNCGIEVEQFVLWAKSFEALCQENDWLCPVELPLKLLELDKKLETARELILVGFDELTPLHQHFLQNLNSAIRFFQPDTRQNEVKRLALPNNQEELLLMARWAKTVLMHHTNARVACIIPELSSLRASVQRVFSEAFEKSDLNFNISAGQSLTQFNFIQTALDLLSLRQNNNPWEVISTLLCSGYLNTQLENQLIAAETDRCLREKMHSPWLSLNIVKSILIHLKNDYPNSDFSERWQAWQEQLSQAPTKALPSHWLEHFKKELELMGWSKQSALNSEENALLQDWEKAVQELAQFDLLCGTINRSSAIKLLRNIAQSSIFQLKSKGSRLQILGVLEASGLDFDAMWIMGLSDRNWPSAARPNPFIPHYQQRNWQMPHADHERELQYCLRIQERLFNSSSTLLVSYALEDRNLKQNASHLIKDIPEITAEQLITQFEITDYQSKAQALFANRAVEFIEDYQAPTLSADEKIKGGSYILKEQALCPFRAFAHIRLNAFALNEPQLGLSPLCKGVLAHKALEVFWKKIKNQARLLALTENELTKEIESCVDQAIRRSDESPSFLKIERVRLIKILNEWLDFEKRRDSFQVIAEEASFHTQLGELELDLRIDRIDQLEDGSYLIIDYKTGSPTIGSWFDERIVEPQLPLYAAYAFEKAEAIAFAQLKTGQMKLKGISASDKKLAGLVPLEKCRYELKSDQWPDLIARWKDQLANTAHDFHEGKASVDPYKPALACQQCDLQALCRINEIH